MKKLSLLLILIMLFSLIPVNLGVVYAAGTGLTGYYFSTNDLSGSSVTQVDSQVNFNWGGNGPTILASKKDNFSVRWKGTVAPLYSQTYTFYTQSDDGVRLWVDGTKLIDQWTAHSSTEHSGSIALVAGRKYDIVMEYCEYTGDAIAQLSWKSNSQSKQIIPSAQLYPFVADITPPKVLSVSAMESDNTYYIDDSISVTVTFDEIVNVNTANGIPNIKLNAGSNTYAVYQGGSGTETLTFKYIVTKGDAASDLDYTASDALQLNNSTIQDIAGNAAVLSLPAAGALNSLEYNKNIVINTNEGIRILELQPGNSFDITTAIKNNLKSSFNRNIELTQMSISLFNAKVDEINGYYDIIYVGNNTTGSQPSYFRIGEKSSARPNYSSTISNGVEYYDGNDITARAAQKLIRFIESNQLTIFNSNIINGASIAADTNIKKLFKDYVGKKSFNICSVNTLTDSISNYISAQTVAKRPQLQITSAPVQYDGSNPIVNMNMMGFSYNIRNSTLGQNMNIKLYVDKNGDGIFLDSEVVEQRNSISDGNGYSINYKLPTDYTDLVPWKLEVMDTISGAKCYRTGAAAYVNKELNIKILQLMSNVSDNGTLNLTSLSNYNGQNLLYKPGLYKFDITAMRMDEFNNNYGKLVNGKPTLLTGGNYNMVIIGFDDSYVGDLSGAALNALVDFAESGQSVMFTHDTIGYQTSSHNLTNSFKDRLGLNIFATIPKNLPSPDQNKNSLGMTRLALKYASNQLAYFPDTVNTKKINENYSTLYPFVLGDIIVSPTHLQYLRLNLEDPEVVPVYNYKNGNRFNHGYRTGTPYSPTTAETYYNENDAGNDYYTYTRGNLTMSGTGHSPITSLGEYQMFLNTMMRAAKGANKSPEISLGISAGQNVSKTNTSLTFPITVTDYDIDDQYFMVKVYVNSTLVQTYAIDDSVIDNRFKNGQTKTITLPLGLSQTTNQFSVRVEAYDNEGANDIETRQLNYVSLPTISLNSSNIGCLKGDTINLGLTILPQATTQNDTLTNINITTIRNINAFDLGDNNGWTVNGTNLTKTISSILKFEPAPSWESQQAILSLKANSTGIYPFAYSASYFSKFENATKSSMPLGSYTVDVRDGLINVDVSNGGKGVANVPVTISRYTGSSWEDVVGRRLTSSTGLLTLANVISGQYKVTVVPPEGYGAASNSQTFEVNYGNNSPTATFLLEGSTVKDSSIKSESGKSAISTIVDGTINAKIDFKLTGATTMLEFDLNTTKQVASGEPIINISDVKFEAVKLFKDDVQISNFTVIGNRLIMPANLVSGTYKAVFTVNTGNSVQANNKYDLNISNIIFKNSNVNYTGDNKDQINPMTTPLTLNIVKSPRIE